MQHQNDPYFVCCCVLNCTCGLRYYKSSGLD